MLSNSDSGTIWIVDDSATDADRVAKTLQGEFTVKIFSDGAVALEELSSSKMPDLLLLDWIMPGMSGLEICTYIRSSRSAVSQIPIILLTSQTGPNEIAQAFQKGANDYIVKPFIDEELKARVRTLTSSRRHLQRAQNLVKALQRSEERLLLATSSAGVGIWEWDIKQGSVTSTEIHRAIFELPSEGQFAFSALYEKILPEDREAVQKSLSNAIESKKDYFSEFRIQKLDGTIAWITGRGRTVYGDDEAPLRMVGIHVDISIQKQAEAELKRAKETAERATHMKSAFLANMSHEIRTPLGAMLGFAHLMQDPAISAMELSEYIEILTRNGEQLSIIINDILDLSKVEAGLLTFEHSEFNPAELCSEVVNLFKAKAKQAGLTLECLKESSTPAIVSSDPMRLRQILANLVSNALKFTPAGGIKIKSSGAIGAGGQKYLVVDVEDTGIGVSGEHADKIFDRFAQADDSTTRKFGGTGIGLTLSRQLARELGGELELLRSENKTGSTFRVTVKNAQEKTQADAAQNADDLAANPSPISLQGIRVLVVDDAPDNQKLLSLYLSKKGAVVETAANGLEGYQKALRNVYDIVLMDLQMPQMDGYATTKKLRSVGYKKPIIALTAHAMTEVSAQCIEAGCSGYLPKPIDPGQLVATIAMHAHY